MNNNQQTAIDKVRAEVLNLLHEAVKRDASDLHLIPGFPASFRIHGQLHEASRRSLDPDTVAAMIESLVPDDLAKRVGTEKNSDFSIAITREGGPSRFRANVFLAQGQLCACLRHIPEKIPSFEWLGFPRGLAERLVSHRNGLVIITGVTGSGKSTTLAALVDVLNQRGGYRLITVEEPVEYIHPQISSSIVTQREVGRDVDSFFDGLKYGLRQDPDVILVGEIRDRDTAQMAISAAETGHLILTTLHTRDAKGAITRLVDLFPRTTQDDIRTQLAMSLRAVVSQHLLPSTQEGEKRVLALEILHVTNPVRVAVKFGKIESIESAIQTGKRDGMLTLDEDLERLLREGRISSDTVRRFAKDPNGMATLR
jgi:twitching motility protein PilT